MKKNLLAGITVAALMTVGVQALPITGSLWKVPEAVTQNAVPANVPATAPDVTFDVNSPFTFWAEYATVGTWLGTSSAYNIVEDTAGTLASLMDDYQTGTFVQFLGQVTVVNGMTFTVTHDDGLSLIIGGVDLGFSPSPTAPITSVATYNGPTGTFPFELVYAECCSGPAVLQVDLPFSNVPDGGTTLALLGGALALLGAVSRRLRR